MEADIGARAALLAHPRFTAHDAVDAFGDTALTLAASNGHTSTCAALLGCARFTARAHANDDGDTALSLAHQDQATLLNA